MSEPLHTEPVRPIESRSTARRERRLPATGMPVKGEGRRTSSVVSLLIHVLIILLIAMPMATHTGDVKEIPQGGGGPGPVGGGGGGHNGTGGVLEKVHYVAVAPAPKPAPAAVIPPPVTPPPKPVVPPPQPQPQVKPPEVIAPEPPKLEVKVAEAKLPDATAPTPGTGGGSGRDGSSGNGPGSGGGVGSGIGTGRGSNVGPGTGGGTQANYPPSTTELFLPPLPYPDKVRGFHLVAEFDVDSTGKVLNYTFTPTRDGGYNRRLEETLKNTKFRPGTTPDGRPIRMKAQIIYDF